MCSDENKFSTGSEKLVKWLVNRGYTENLVREQVVRTCHLDREVLIKQENRHSEISKEQIPLVVTFHPAPN